MRDQEIIGLNEAYASIYASQEEVVEETEQLDEGEKPFPHEKVEAKQKSLRDKGGNALERRMRMGLARRRAKEAKKTGGSQQDAGKGWYHAREEVDIYDLILSHLLDEGYAETLETANAIMANMSEEWRDDIVEDIRGAITYNPNTPLGRLKRRIKGSTPEKREKRTREYTGNKAESGAEYASTQRGKYDDNTGDIPAVRRSPVRRPW